MSEPLVVLSDVTKRYGERTILDGVSLTVQPGETVALLGPSGGGKSTLLRCVNGLTAFESGEVRVGPHRLGPGRCAIETAGALRRLFGMVFQDFQLFPHLTALGNVIEAPIQVLGMKEDEARTLGRQLLERVGLGDRLDAWPKQLSGGQKQRVAIARALAMRPRGLLCDEATSALDPEMKHEVLGVLEAIRKEGVSILMVTHEIAFARRAADRVVVLAGGKVVEDGPAAQVIDSPRAPRTRQFFERVLG